MQMRAPGAGQVAHLSTMYKDVQHSGVLVEQVPHTRTRTHACAHRGMRADTRAHTEACARTYARTHARTKGTNRRTHSEPNTHAHAQRTRACLHSRAAQRTRACLHSRAAQRSARARTGVAWQFKAAAAAREKIDLWETVVVAEGNW